MNHIFPEELTIEAGKEEFLMVSCVPSTHIHLQQGSKLTFVALVTEGWEGKRILNIHFDGKNAEALCLILIEGRESNEFVFETVSNHTVPQTKAAYYVRNVLFDRAFVDYKGNLIIQRQAQITDSYLAHHSLMLSKDAKAYSIPSLEIEADDVKAGHAATIGSVDEEMLFYCMSRGMNRNEASEMLVQGFMGADLQKISSEEMRMKVAREMETRLLKC